LIGKSTSRYPILSDLCLLVLLPGNGILIGCVNAAAKSEG